MSWSKVVIIAAPSSAEESLTSGSTSVSSGAPGAGTAGLFEDPLLLQARNIKRLAEIAKLKTKRIRMGRPFNGLVRIDVFGENKNGSVAADCSIKH
jgi:hypothetical protein